MAQGSVGGVDSSVPVGSSAGGPAPVGPVGSPAVPVPVVPDGPVKASLDLLRQILAVLAAVLMGPMAPAARKRLPKIRQKAWRLVPQLLELVIRKPAYAPAGQDPNALLLEYQIATGLQVLLSSMAAARTSIADTVRQKEADVWKAMLVIYGVLSAQAGSDPEVSQLVAQMSQAMSNGPRAQKSVKSVLAKPTVVKGRKAKEVLLAAARAESGIPDPKATPAEPTNVGSSGSSGSPAVPPVVVPTPSVSPAGNTGGSSGTGNGPAHQG